jgi:hypothetical protein
MKEFVGSGLVFGKTIFGGSACHQKRWLQALPR